MSCETAIRDLVTGGEVSGRAGGSSVRLALPKGRMHEEVVRLLGDAGVRLGLSSRDYRPSVSLDGFEVKILKPRAIVEMLELGSRDVGFAGADWVAETGAELIELLDTGLNPVRLVAAAPESVLTSAGGLPDRRLVIATEFVNLTSAWIARRGFSAGVLRSYGATEVLPPEDADGVVDTAASGATLAANGLREVETLMRSSTRLYASPSAMEDRGKRLEIERFVMLVRSVLEARRRVMIELNVPSGALVSVVAVLPCMREPTVSPLSSSRGYAVKAAVLREVLPTLIPEVTGLGGTDVVITRPEQIVVTR